MKKTLKQRISDTWEYVSKGVWSDPRETFKVRVIKIINLSVSSFFDRDLQKNSMSLTYSTILAIVPALAMIFAIARGFGFQNIIHDELFKYFPAQQRALEAAFDFVSSYLAQASQGVFVGVGVLFLLWTLISLLSGIEDVFNGIWGVKDSRKIASKITDYLSVCILVPVLFLLSSGISIFLNTMFNQINVGLLAPLTSIMLELVPFVLSWLAFTFTFYLMPNTKVEFKYAMLSGFLCMLAFQIVQWLFLTGQIYVSKYNAIYGSFSFLPLLLIWLQLSWLIVLSCCVLCYSMQNVLGFNFMSDIDTISRNYLRKVSLVTFALIMHRYDKEKPPLASGGLAQEYGLPAKLVSKIVTHFLNCGLVYKVDLGTADDFGLVPAVDKDRFTVGELFKRLDDDGKSGFIPHFSSRYSKVLKIADKIIEDSYGHDSDILVKDIPLTRS